MIMICRFFGAALLMIVGTLARLVTLSYRINPVQDARGDDAFEFTDSWRFFFTLCYLILPVFRIPFACGNSPPVMRVCGTVSDRRWRAQTSNHVFTNEQTASKYPVVTLP